LPLRVQIYASGLEGDMKDKSSSIARDKVRPHQRFSSCSKESK